MSELKVRSRPSGGKNDNGKSHYVAGEGPYAEFVFNNDRGGGMVLAQGLDMTGRVQGIVYAPGCNANVEVAQSIAAERLAEIKTVWEIRFAPF